MSNTSLVLDTSTRYGRGYALYTERGEEILLSYRCGVYLVPGTEPGVYYAVNLKLGTCECPDFENAERRRKADGALENCKHLIAAELCHVKSASCSACARRKFWRELTEVQSEDNLLAFFPGDRLCSVCCAAGHWC